MLDKLFNLAQLSGSLALPAQSSLVLRFALIILLSLAIYDRRECPEFGA